jgi:hypothetical protein
METYETWNEVMSIQEICGFYGGEYLRCRVHKYDITQSSTWLPIYHKNMLLPSSG